MKSIKFILGWWMVLAMSGCSMLPQRATEAQVEAEAPVILPTIIATSAPTALPTLQPVPRAHAGDLALFNGDFDNALVLYQAAFRDSPDKTIQASAKWGEAKVWFTKGSYSECLAALDTLMRVYPDSPFIGQAYFIKGLANYRIYNFGAAAKAWESYLTLRPGYLDAYVEEMRGDALYEMFDYGAAITAYEAAIKAPALGDGSRLKLKLGSAYAKSNNHQAALDLYEALLVSDSNDYIKAQANYEAGRVLQAIGKVEEATTKFQFNVENYQLSYYAYLSLVALLEGGATVNQLERGMVDYYAGQYDVAIDAFSRAISESSSQDGSAYYYRALSYREIGNYEAALKDFTTFTTRYQAHPRWGEAWGEKAFIEWYQMGSYNAGAKTLLDFVDGVPSSPLAMDYLMSAGRIYERAGKTKEALQVWARVVNEYPNSEQAPYAAFLMGILYYRNGDATSALDAFSRSLAISVQADDKARALLWQGKTQQKLGNETAAMAAWREGQNRDAGGYYSERARELLLGNKPFETSANVNLMPDLNAERRDADSWVRLTFNLPAETDLSGLDRLRLDERVIRGSELWEMGMYEDARLEFENLRTELELKQDAVGSYRLMNGLREIGLYRSAVLCARQVLALAGLDEHRETMMAPTFFSRVRYGLYYSDLVVPAARSNNLDPLFLFSVIRQESLFEGFVVSHAGARGLMQIIPSTGAQLVSQVGWPANYVEDDLYRPNVSIALGARYLANNRRYLDGNLYATLAAYNGGPGNALEWKRLAGDDPDLLLESVRFEETRNYIRNIYEIYSVYQWLYGSG